MIMITTNPIEQSMPRRMIQSTCLDGVHFNQATRRPLKYASPMNETGQLIPGMEPHTPDVTLLHPLDGPHPGSV